ncbi:MAG: twin-arginine translocase TatA/TatE family subunit [Chloroflexi bacterium]|nr:twin-arginine translocase TatA/TatE family subunit [Chloroflexota bacterium]
MFGSLGAPELLIILAIVVVLFGATRIGDIGKGIGRGIREFRSELKDDGEGDEGEGKEGEEKKPEGETVTASTVAPAESSDEDTKPTSQSQ